MTNSADSSPSISDKFLIPALSSISIIPVIYKIYAYQFSLNFLHREIYYLFIAFTAFILIISWYHILSDASVAFLEKIKTGLLITLGFPPGMWIIAFIIDCWWIFLANMGEFIFKEAPFNAPTTYSFPIAAACIGLFLHFTRINFRSFYGLAESLLGIFIAIKIAPTQLYLPRNIDTYTLLLTASIFLIVRGLDNIQTGLTKDPRDIYFIKLLKYMELIK